MIKEVEYAMWGGAVNAPSALMENWTGDSETDYKSAEALLKHSERQARELR